MVMDTITLADLGKSQEFKRLLGRIGRQFQSEGLKDIYLVGSLAKHGRTQKDIDVLLNLRYADPQKIKESERIYFEKCSGVTHISSVWDPQTVLFTKVKGKKMPVDIWATDEPHLSMAMRTFRLRKRIKLW